MTDLRRVDINLIMILDAILTEQHLTRAGERLGISQPAVSGALARLRRIYNDPLLARSGGSLELTPKAEAIRPLVREARLQILRTFELSPTFDPKHSTRKFLISASDYVLSYLTSPLLIAFGREAPGATVEFDGLPSDFKITPVDLLRRDAMIAGAGTESQESSSRCSLITTCASPIRRTRSSKTAHSRSRIWLNLLTYVAPLATTQ